MRPHRAVVPAPEVHVEARLDSLPQDSGRSLAVGVIVNVGMVAADRAAILHRQRRTSKKLRSTAAQACSCTPPTTSGRWWQVGCWKIERMRVWEGKSV